MSSISCKNITRQRPRLLYAYSFSGGKGWINDKTQPENAEIILIGNGRGKAELNESVFPFTSGDLIVCNKGCAHREFFDDATDVELILIGVGNLRLYGFEPDTLLGDREFCIVHTGEFFEPLRTYARQLIIESEGNQPLKENIAQNLLKIILLFTVRLVSYDSLVTFDGNAKFTAAKNYFDEHFLEFENVDAVCKYLYINKYYLTHLFTQNAGMPPVKYVINKRIELACNYLETTDDNVADIGARCGYSDPAYFCRTFKKVKGVTPLRYRYLFKENKKNESKKTNK